MAGIIKEESMGDLWNLWFSELHKGTAGLTIKIKGVLFSGKSDFQRIDVLDTEEFGKVLVLYGSIMITERDEFIYHEMLSHVPLFVHPDPKEVLIIGGGDGGTLREVLRHPEVKRAAVVEIDRMVVDVCKRFFPEVSRGFDNPRGEVVFEDAAKFLVNNKNKYDLILCDSSDPVGPAEVLFQKNFYEMISESLSPDGIFVAQSESPIFHGRTIEKVYKNLKDIFPIVKMYLAHIPTYPSGTWSFAFCSKKYDPLAGFLQKKYDSLKLPTRYYNNKVHAASFMLPNFVRDLVE